MFTTNHTFSPASSQYTPQSNTTSGDSSTQQPPTPHIQHNHSSMRETATTNHETKRNLYNQIKALTEKANALVDTYEKLERRIGEAQELNLIWQNATKQQRQSQHFHNTVVDANNGAALTQIFQDPVQKEYNDILDKINALTAEYRRL